MHWAVVIDYICPGGCQLALHGDRLYLYSGHTVTVDKEDRSESDTVHDDLWSIDLNTFAVRSTCPVSHPAHCAAPGCSALVSLVRPKVCPRSSLSVRKMRRLSTSSQ